MSTTRGEPPTVHEHITMNHYGDESVYSKYPKEFNECLARIQSIESLEGVLAAHVGSSVADGKHFYLHHFRTVDEAARKRAALASHSANAALLVSISETARQTLHNIRADLGKDDEDTVNHHLSAKRLLTDFRSTAHSDWTTEASSSPPPRYPSVRMGVIKAKEGTSAKVLDECIKEFRSLPARFPLLGQVSIGRSNSTPYLAQQHYPATSVVDWDLGFVFSYASAHDRQGLDSDSNFQGIQKKWRSILGGNYHTWDLDVHNAAALENHGLLSLQPN